MQQVVQDIRAGDLNLNEVPVSMVESECVVVANSCSVISAGAEKMTKELAQKAPLASMLEKRTASGSAV